MVDQVLGHIPEVAWNEMNPLPEKAKITRLGTWGIVMAEAKLP